MKIYPILEEHLPLCAGCSGQWDNYDTGAYCRYGQDPDRCRGPKESRSEIEVGKKECHGNI